MERAPLALLHPDTVQQRDRRNVTLQVGLLLEWLLTVCAQYPDRLGGIQGVVGRAGHRWLVLPSQETNTAWIFSQWDNRSELDTTVICTTGVQHGDVGAPHGGPAGEH